MHPLIVTNPHATDMMVYIQPGAIEISLPPKDVIEIEIHDLPEGETIAITPDGKPSLTLFIPTSHFTIRNRLRRLAAAAE